MTGTGTISYFFRDKKGIEKGIDSVVGWGTFPKIWSAGCSLGQEPFTIAILLAERFTCWRFKNTVIYATDLEEKFGERIKKGVYAENEVNAVITNKGNIRLIEKYLKKSNNTYAVVPELRNKIIFKKHDLLREEPVAFDFNLITCKNVFEYFSIDEKRKVYEKFFRALTPEGVLVIDPKQRGAELEAPANIFERIDAECPERIYRKKKQVSRVTIKEDFSFNKSSDYSWINIEMDDVRIGKMRAKVVGRALIVQSITIFSEFQRRGFAKEVIDYYKGKYKVIIADRVRPTARIFWEKMRFVDSKDGNCVWERRLEKGCK
ncbi:MAG: hypothetical protein J7L53_06275 [Deltaproteobacteria bacterium]|nr:hypothetical protein [Deltaproteobacteria bacterium]